jgi:hypothetical protein
MGGEKVAKEKIYGFSILEEEFSTQIQKKSD